MSRLMRRGGWILILAATGANAALATATTGVPTPPLPQILPVPQVGPLAPSGSNSPHQPGSGPPQQLPDCPRFSSQQLGTPHVRRLRISIRRVADSFRSNMFGIAAGGLIQKESCQSLARELNDDAQAHARWLRIDINWAEIQDGGRSHYDWSRIDRVVKLATANGLRVLGGIVYTPWWARPSGTYATYAPRAADYAAFAAVAVRHYARLGVNAYEVWNEPNSSMFWRPAPDPVAYTVLLKAAYVAIKHADPSATVLTGGTAPGVTAAGSYSPVDFLAGIYGAGGKGYFDAIGHHPYCWPLRPGARLTSSAWYQMYGTSPSLRSVMIANGDGAKKIWATEFGAPTDGPAGTYVDAAQQARMLIRAYKLFAGYRWAGPLFFYQGRDLGTDPRTEQDFFGLTKFDFSPKPAYAAYRSVSSAVSRALRRRSSRSGNRRSATKRPAR